MSKILNTRIQHKTDTTANWDKATNFIPLKGELIVYDDNNGQPPKFKVGDGISNIKDLRFSTVDEVTKATQDANGNVITSTYATKTELNGKANSSHTHKKADITDFPTFSDTDTTYDLAATKSADNGSVKLNLTASGSGSGTDSVTIKGTGYTTVTSDSNGVITINSTGDGTGNNGVSLSDDTPKGAGTATPGTSNTASRSDHVHPVDTSRADVEHTHKYAASESIGGPANSAKKLTVDAGSEETPTYFKDGVPVACTNILAERATKDASGNNIIDTYATKDELSNVPSDSYDDTELKNQLENLNTTVVELGKTVENIENDYVTSNILDGYATTDDINNLQAQIDQLADINPCLIEGTKILMADDTTKNIEDVREGELIKSWDIDNNTFVDVRCLTTRKTGISREWSLYVFDNSSILTIYDPHGIYCKDTQCIHNSKLWKEGQRGISSTGIETEFCGKETREDPTYHNRYVLLSENNLYFANNILCGHLPTAKLRYHIQNYIKTATEEEIDLYRKEVEIYDTFKNWRTEPVYLSRTMKIRSKYRQANEVIVKNKKQLAGLDYKTIKRLQGELSDEEWQEVVSFCINCRNIINAKEEEKVQLMDQISQIRTELGIVHNSAKDCFKACYDLDMQYIKSRQTV